MYPVGESIASYFQAEHNFEDSSYYPVLKVVTTAATAVDSQALPPSFGTKALEKLSEEHTRIDKRLQELDSG